MIDDAIKKQIYALWNEGLSASAIAAKFGITRNSVVGMAHRARKTGEVTRKGDPRVNPQNPNTQPKAKIIRLPKKPPLTTIQPRLLKTEEPMERDMKPVVIPMEPPKKTAKPKSIMQLGSFDCRWIVSPGRYCGAESKSARYPWCEEHYRMVYTPGSAKRGS